MLFLIMGASGSGKLSCLAGLQRLLPEIAWRDFDDAPSHPTTTAERQQNTEYWLQHALENQSRGIATGIVGTTVLGEVLACPSAPAIDHIHALLLDCADLQRIERIRSRERIRDLGLEVPAPTAATQDMLSWSAWLRMHAADPQWRPDVIQAEGAPNMNWQTWSTWQKNDPRWNVPILDNTTLTIEATVQALAAWASPPAPSRDL